MYCTAQTHLRYVAHFLSLIASLGLLPICEAEFPPVRGTGAPVMHTKHGAHASFVQIAEETVTGSSGDRALNFHS